MVAGAQGGVVSRAQLVARGIPAKAIEYRVKVGRLRALHRGVYAVGHDALPTRGRLVAGLLVAGPNAALSHRTAAGLWKLTPSMPQLVEVTTTTNRPRSRPGLAFHRARELDTRIRDDLPVTSPIRTLKDLAATRPYDEVERVTSEALVLQLVNQHALAQQQGPGAAVLARLAGAGVAPTRSELERLFLKAVLKFGLPKPLTNHRIGPHEVDFCWPEHRLVVETDGARFHAHHIANRRDHPRDADLQLRGYAVLRFTWQDVVQRPAEVAARVGRFLSRASRRAS
jgi:very-short-patch-repair endonuclease